MTDRKNKKLPIRSKGGNDYLISTGIPQVLLLHPVLDYLVKLRESGTNLDEWIEKPGNNGIEIENGIRVNGEEDWNRPVPKPPSKSSQSPINTKIFFETFS